MNGTTNLIDMKRDGTDVLIDFRPSDGLVSQRRWIRAQDAWALGLLLTSEAPPNVLDFKTDWLSLQIENNPHRLAWLSMTGIRGGQTRRLTACLKDGALARVGAALLELSGPALLGRSIGRMTICRRVSHFYLARACESRVAR